MATDDQNFSQPQTQVILSTVMNPDGVSRPEWSMMFEGVRRSIADQVEPLNDYIERFNNYFKNCSPEKLQKHSDFHKKFTKEELITHCTPIQINSLDSIENVKSIINK